MEGFAKILEGISHVIGVLSWPLLVIFLTYRFGSSIGDFLNNIGEGTFKGFGVEATAKRKAEVIAAIAAAQVESDAKNTENKQFNTVPAGERFARNLAASERLITPLALKVSTNKIILWVDDRPDGNFYERKALSALGIKIWSARDTESALDFLDNGNSIDLIISDLSRPEGDRAGFELLEKIKNKNITLPFIVYSGYKSPDLKQKAKNLGAFGYTTDPGKLIQLVLNALKIPSVFD